MNNIHLQCLQRISNRRPGVHEDNECLQNFNETNPEVKHLVAKDFNLKSSKWKNIIQEEETERTTSIG